VTEAVIAPLLQRTASGAEAIVLTIGQVPPAPVKETSWSRTACWPETLAFRVSVDVAWNRNQSVSRFVPMPRPVPRSVVGGKEGVAIVVKKFGVESQPSFVAVP
jgi:hypothetical protein